MTSEDWNLVSYEDAESDEQVVLSPEFTASAIVDVLHDSPHPTSATATYIPGTHIAAKGRLSVWLANHSARNPQQRFNLLWVHGPAGVGKTALMQILANALLPSESSSVITVSPEGDARPAHPPSYEAGEFGTAGIQYGGTALFFSKDHHIMDASKFFVTLAYGLARRLPPLAAFIQSAFDFASQLRSPSSREQAKILIMDPIKAWVLSEDGDVDVDLIIVVDGLDTFENKKAQTEVVDIVREVSTQHVDGVRWLWVFSSRTEARLHDVFVGSKPSVSPKAEVVAIGLASEAEMKAYLEGATAKIHQTHPVFRNARSVEEEWPTAQDITTIQWQAAGLYAAASSIISYIANPTSNPRTRISLIEDPTYVHDGSDNPYAKLDAMYKDILANVPPTAQPTIKRILGAISCVQPSSHDQQPPTLTLLSSLLDIEINEILRLLYDLHSVVHAPIEPITATRGRNTPQDHFHLNFHHQSFDQFLRTPTRSLTWSLNLESMHMDLARCCLQKLSSGLAFGSPAWKYAKKRWCVHCWRTGKDTEAALGILPDLFEFDYSALSYGNDGVVVDRYFIEWLLHLQETTMSEWQLLNPGPFVELTANPLLADELGLDSLCPDVGEGSSSSNATSRGGTKGGKKLPARKSYILGLEPAKQVYLVPFYDVKVQWRTDLGQQVGPREKHWDWIRGFRVVPCDYMEAYEYDEEIADARQAQDSETGPSRKDGVTTDDDDLYA